LDSSIVIEFYSSLVDSKEEKVAFKLFLPRRCLFMFAHDLYQEYFHCIREAHADKLDASVLNIDSEQTDQLIPRSRRLSFTIRHSFSVCASKSGNANSDFSSGRDRSSSTKDSTFTR